MSEHHARLQAIRQRYPVEHPEHSHRRRLTRLDRTALAFTSITGDVRFFVIAGILIICWMLWNSAAPRPLRFDPFPAFLILLGATKLVQLLFMPLIMVGQHLESKRAKAHAETAHRAAMRDAEETELVLSRLDEIEALLNERLPPREA